MLSSAQLASITATVAKALDVTLPLSRKSVAPDGYGHSTETWASVGNVQVNIINPSATQLQIYAGKIGSQRALLIRAMQTTDIRENDAITYDGLLWLVQNLQDAESYTVTREYLLTTIA